MRESHKLVAPLKRVSVVLSSRIMTREKATTRASQGKRVVWSEVGGGPAEGGMSYIPNHIAMEPLYRSAVQQCTT